MLEPVNDSTVIRVKHDLAKTSDGLKVLEYLENHIDVRSHETFIASVDEQSNIYSEDLIHYLDCAHEENVKILKSCDLADCLRM
jgi:hypothetical protein